jgi:hypothetical protein
VCPHWLDPAGIGGGAGPRASFAEAFFFSLQTLGSIGFGVLHPVSLYANLLVTAESLSGLLFVAITTGLAFARFARAMPASAPPVPCMASARRISAGSKPTWWWPSAVWMKRSSAQFTLRPTGRWSICTSAPASSTPWRTNPAAPATARRA